MCTLKYLFVLKVANEDSLKLLNSYLDALGSYKRPQPVHLQFYIHPSSVKERGGVVMCVVDIAIVFRHKSNCSVYANIMTVG